MKTALIYDKWLSGLGGGEVVACTVATILRDEGYTVTIVSKEQVTQGKVMDKLNIDLQNITLSTNQELLKTKPDLFINISFMDYRYGIGKRNIYYVHFPSIIRTGLFNNVLIFFQKSGLHRFFPKMLRERVDDRLRAGVFPDMRKRLDSYDTFICHSEFVKEWVQAMWDKEAVVIYPPVRLVRRSNQTSKKNWITSVGRFFTLGHGKKQEVLIEAFKKLHDKSSISNLQLHLIGGVGNEPSSLRYVEQLKAMASGYPIYFHFKAERNEVEQILMQSKIYWHAGGYGESEPINFEHFGIAPVEAISAGCMPVLFDGGGLTEIVNVLNLPRDIHLFRNIHELIEHTINLLNYNSKPRMFEKCERQFSISTFKKTFLQLLSNV